MKPFIHVRQDSPLLDTPVWLRAGNLTPGGVFTIHAAMYDNLGTKWESSAKYRADGNGEIDLAAAEPLAGSYSSADAAGLFWSMTPVPNAERRERTPLKALVTEFTLMNEGKVLASEPVSRQLVAPGIERLPVREDDLIGTFFRHAAGDLRPTIVVLGGSEGGLRESTAALLASHGFNALALAYFGLEGLPEELVNVPIETVGRAIEWLRGQPDVQMGKLGVVGTSKGGELALLSASFFPAIKAVAAFVPSGVVYPGLGRTPGSSWQVNGEPLPFAYGKVPDEVTADVQRAKRQNTPISWRDTYKYWETGETSAEIPVERIKGPVLLLSGGDDRLWPADWLSERVIDRLKRYHHPFDAVHNCYPDAGHSLGVPGMPTSQSAVSSYGNGMTLSLGGTPAANAAAQYRAWHELVHFLQTHLAGNPAAMSNSQRLGGGTHAIADPQM
ncbi:acyl-CoA thioesterase [Sporosarcina sp. NCCP-2716]|uniref:acyl-CoA thioesterase/bile acid-CoA:amino acid N-acyltransferase family protein n=1 Tax=Sporosarcina sp. NCCP-2716 TaxID=2943679 RepID=UPI00203D8F71|nr:acyl-CoA thioesterase/bile acid-CoA:amino acid N-acyltransferase family protein [Sporosarcina sp. NCCP-2716]GKV68648.1 acyl-CoA thioesterase [Sporosarcina sp. NCCP-2716]